MPRVLQFIDTENSKVVARGWEEAAIGSYCLVGMELRFRMIKKCWRCMVLMVAQQCECT